MDAFTFCLALGPLAMYLLLLGLVNLAHRPLVVSGARDTVALGLALAGFVVGGPMRLFMPEEAATQFGPYVWLLLLSFYALCVSLWILLARPRLVVYNVSLPALRPALLEAARAIDAEAAMAGDALSLPQLGVQLHLEYFKLLRNVSLVATGELQSFVGWRRLELELRGKLRELEVAQNPRGMTLVIVSLVIVATMLTKTLENPQAVAQGFWTLLRM